MRVADLMSHSVIAIARDAPLSQAVQMMLDNHISGLPVVDPGGQVVGMLTEGDLLRRAETGTQGKTGWFTALFALGRQADRYIQTHARRVNEIMTPDVVTVGADSSLDDAVSLMERHGIKRLPVVVDDRLVEIISRADFVRELQRKLCAAVQIPTDAGIIDAIRAELARQPWAHNRFLTITAEKGVVQIDGCVFDLRERDAIQVVAENTAGVTAVHNRLACVEPNTGIVFSPEDDDQNRPTA